MRIFAFFLILLFFQSVNYGQGTFYYHANETIPLFESPDLVFVELEPSLSYKTEEEVENLLGTYGLLVENFYADQKVCFARIKGEGEIKNKIALARNSNMFESVQSVFSNEMNLAIAVTNKIIVKLHDQSKQESLRYLSNLPEVERTYKIDHFENAYVCEIGIENELQILAFANALHKNALFEYAHPNFLSIVQNLGETNDPELSSSYAIENDGALICDIQGIPGADMNVKNAWDVTTGSSEVVIAVIDEGVELTHEDLVDNMVTGFDATGGGTAGANSSEDGHGTACSGAAAAVGDNGIGIAGIAYNCKIMPVRAWSSTFGQTPESVAQSIQWSWQNGADVISMSFGVPQTDLVDDALRQAVLDGRDGLGSILLASSGNDNSSSVGYPSSNRNVISVGASNMCDERKRCLFDTTGCNTGAIPTLPSMGLSCDVQDGSWGCLGSQYGENLDIMAPGVCIQSTRTGNGYFSSFWLTSAACPLAAGAAALVISANQSLGAGDVRQILQSTCRKAGGYAYELDILHQSGSWNVEMGYGVVDAYAAVLLANNYSGVTNQFGDRHERFRSNAFSQNWYHVPYELADTQFVIVHPNVRQYGHNGVDLNSFPPDYDDENDEGCIEDSDVGLPIIAAADGVVRYVVDSFCCRNFEDTCEIVNDYEINSIFIEHANDEWSVYHHIALNTALVSVGESVLAGQEIAAEGEVGPAGGVHLHFAVYWGYTGPYDFTTIAPRETQGYFLGQKIPLLCNVKLNYFFPGDTIVNASVYDSMIHQGAIGDCGNLTNEVDSLTISDTTFFSVDVLQANEFILASLTVVEPAFISTDSCSDESDCPGQLLFCSTEQLCRTNGGSVVFRAGNNIVLKPGFHAKSASFFRAEIGPFH